MIRSVKLKDQTTNLLAGALAHDVVEEDIGRAVPRGRGHGADHGVSGERRLEDFALKPPIQNMRRWRGEDLVEGHQGLGQVENENKKRQ